MQRRIREGQRAEADLSRLEDEMYEAWAEVLGIDPGPRPEDDDRGFEQRWRDYCGISE